jgi:hypothetical protein
MGRTPHASETSPEKRGRVTGLFWFGFHFVVGLL